LLTCSITTRAMTSLALPAPSGTTTVMFFVGHSCAAAEPEITRPASAANVAANESLGRVIIVPSCIRGICYLAVVGQSLTGTGFASQAFRLADGGDASYRRGRERQVQGPTMNASAKGPSPRIARIWRGRTTRAKADEYAAYLYEQGIRPLEQKALGVQSLREDRATETEFVTISYWASVEAMAVFAGKDPRRIHHLERDAEFLIDLPQGVQILDIVNSSGNCGGG
jgi:hypothetical protein